MKTELLESLGLTKNESIIYSTLLSSGTIKVSELLSKSNLNSGRIYDTLESLKNKGLIAESSVNNVKYFTASPPEELEEYFHKKLNEFKEKEEILKTVIKDFKKINQTNTEVSRCVIYYGLRGIKTASDEALSKMSKNEEILEMGLYDKIDNEIDRFWLNWSAKRIARGIKMKQIFSDKGTFYKLSKGEPLNNIRVIDIDAPSIIKIFGKNSLLILDYDKPLKCIFIEDIGTVKSFTGFFNQLWKSAK